MKGHDENVVATTRRKRQLHRVLQFTEFFKLHKKLKNLLKTIPLKHIHGAKRTAKAHWNQSLENFKVDLFFLTACLWKVLYQALF